MTIPQWVVIIVLSGIGAVLWWGVKRIVHSIDETNTSLKVINDTLNEMSGRIGKVETWTEMHEKQDDDRHTSYQQNYDRLYELVSNTQQQ